MRLRFAVPLLLGAALPGCASARPADDPELRTLAAWMTGTFSSAAQHAERPDDVAGVRLVVIPVWPHLDDGPWLYAEQAPADRPEAPDRQGVVHLRREADGSVATDVFALPADPGQFRATWRDETPLCCIRPGDLELRAGCTIRLRRTDDGAWEGDTDGPRGAGDRPGPALAPARIRLADGLLRAWEPGSGTSGDPARGPDAGPCVLVRVSRTPPD